MRATSTSLGDRARRARARTSDACDLPRTASPNVALGGTLHQHVPDIAGTRIRHAQEVSGKNFRGLFDEHVVAVEPDSRLRGIVGASLTTGSRHHQSVAQVAPPLAVVARTPDGVVEALELRDAPSFWVAVQWHPESTVTLHDGQSRALFRALVAAAELRRRAARRSA